MCYAACVMIATTTYSCNTGTSGLPDMYTQSPMTEGVHIRQTTSEQLQLLCPMAHPTGQQ